MKKWDDTIAKREWEQIRDRGHHGHCRESNKIGVCESWDLCVPYSKPRFIDEERRTAAVFYGAIMDWALQKGRDLDFWMSSSSERPTMLLRAIRAVWGKNVR